MDTDMGVRPIFSQLYNSWDADTSTTLIINRCSGITANGVTGAPVFEACRAYKAYTAAANGTVHDDASIWSLPALSQMVCTMLYIDYINAVISLIDQAKRLATGMTNKDSGGYSMSYPNASYCTSTIDKRDITNSSTASWTTYYWPIFVQSWFMYSQSQYVLGTPYYQTPATIQMTCASSYSYMSSGCQANIIQPVRSEQIF
jgi:hypothetical protein